MVSKVPKLKNPQIGLYSIRFRDNKGRFTKALSKASSFQYVLKDGSLSRSFKFDKGIKKVADKNIFIKETLYKIYSAYQSRTKKIEARKADKARREGKIYREKEIEEITTAIGLSKQDRQRFEERGIKIERGNNIARVNRLGLEKRRKKMSQFIKALYSKRWIDQAFELSLINASTEGSPTPIDEKGNYKTIKGKEIDWYAHQVSTGLISGDLNDTSIMLNIIREVTKFFKKELKNYRNFIKITKASSLRKAVLGLYLVTDIEEHEDILFNENSFYQFDIRSDLKNLADSASFKIASKSLSILNEDIEALSDDKGGLTSEERDTVIISPISGLPDEKQKIQKNFKIYPYITIMFLRNELNAKELNDYYNEIRKIYKRVIANG